MEAGDRNAVGWVINRRKRQAMLEALNEVNVKLLFFGPWYAFLL